MAFPVYVYWEGEKPTLVEKCYQTMKRNLKNVIFLNDTNIQNYISDLVDTSHINHIAQKVDYYRAKILYEHGGVWLDSDTIVCDDFDELIRSFLNINYECCANLSELGSEPPVINVSYLFSKTKSDIMKRWCQECEVIINSKRHIGWSDLGGKLLGKIVKEFDLSNRILNIGDFAYHHGYKNYQTFYQPLNLNEIERIYKSQCKIIVLYGTFMYNLDIVPDSLLQLLFHLSTNDKSFFPYDNNRIINLDEKREKWSRVFCKRYGKEIITRLIVTYLLNNGMIKSGMVDTGCWIGDNALPWALNTKSIVYAIDPAKRNVDYVNHIASLNNIKNIKTILAALSDKCETLYTDNHITHCEFNNKSGKTRISSDSLDNLQSRGIIGDIDFIHLDVEGFEEKAIRGAGKLIKRDTPIIIFEQHLLKDNYQDITDYLKSNGYHVYIINELMGHCRPDCRNILAIPQRLLTIEKAAEGPKGLRSSQACPLDIDDLVDQLYQYKDQYRVIPECKDILQEI